MLDKSNETQACINYTRMTRQGQHPVGSTECRAARMRQLNASSQQHVNLMARNSVSTCSRTSIDLSLMCLTIVRVCRLPLIRHDCVLVLFQVLDQFLHTRATRAQARTRAHTHTHKQDLHVKHPRTTFMGVDDTRAMQTACNARVCVHACV
jgi:hypothetical protein